MNQELLQNYLIYKEDYAVICERCKVEMKPGTLYENKNGREVAKRYDMCPKCHDRIYNHSFNSQSMTFKCSKKHKPS